MIKARWVYCSPEWVAQWNACGGTIRRPVLAECSVHTARGPEQEPVPAYHVIGHEHLMEVSWPQGPEVGPIPHESGEPR
jgi:hypothetical protein